MTESATTTAPAKPKRNPTEEAFNVVGYILGISYPLFGISVLARGIVQACCRIRPENAPYVDLLGAAIYLTACIGFFVRRRWAWWLSTGALTLEMACTLIFGTLSIVAPDLVGRNLWTHFGQDYGFIPTIQPILGLLWLLRPKTRVEYGI